MKRLQDLSKQELESLLSRELNIEEYVQKVKKIIEDVAKMGDRAVVEYTKKIDNVEISTPKVELSEIREISSNVSEVVKQAIDTIFEHVVNVNKVLVQKDRIFVCRGMIITFRYVPIDRPGLYVPRNYISTLIMLSSLAHVAGCREIVVTTPPVPGKKISEAFAYAILKIPNCSLYVGNGVACIAAMAYGTETIPKVDKIFGPGNMYIQAAKYVVSSRVAIDGIEGPTELVLYVDTSDEKKIRQGVADTLAELEHGSASIAVVLSKRENVLNLFEEEYNRLSKEKLLGRLVTLLVDDVGQVIEFINNFAPEHVEILVDDVKEAKKIIREVRNAGVISLNTSCTYLDYCAGPCHVLPTSGFARSRGTMTPLDFAKCIAVVEHFDKSLIKHGIVVAELENMTLHKRGLEMLGD